MLKLTECYYGGEGTKFSQFNKGFTLIELLAVIVILAIIALIATPLALNVIEKARESAFKNTAYGLIDTIQLKYAEDYLNGVEEDKTFIFPEAEGLKFSGEKPKGGSIRLTKDGKVSIAIHNGKWCITKGVEESEITIKDYVDDKCILPEEADIPIIKLEGKAIMYLGLGTTYKEPGFSVNTIGGDVIPNDQVIVTTKGQTTDKDYVDTNIEETYTITYSVENNGNKSTKIRTVHVGNYKPTIKVETDGTSGYSKAIEVIISVSAFEQYNINGFSYIVTKNGEEVINTTSTENSKTINLTSDGTYIIKITATDDEGNTSEYTSEPYYIDVTPPSLEMTLSENSINANGWANTDIILNVTTNDIGGSSIFGYKYCTGKDCTPNNTIESTNGVIEINTESNSHYACAISIDNALNESEKVCVGPYMLDKTVKEVKDIKATTSANTNGWYKSNVSVSITTGTDLSTIEEIKYCKTSSSTTCTPNTSITGSSGTVTIDTESDSNYVCALNVDKAGNTSTTKCSGPYKIDKTGPTITFAEGESVGIQIGIGDVLNNYVLKTGVTVTDSLSKLDGSFTTSGTLSAIVGDYTIIYKSTDKAGNITTKTRNVTVVVPKTFTEVMTGNSDVMNNDPDGNLRYVGSDPANYVYFNNELWRVIGVFDGKAKIIKNHYYKSTTVEFDKDEADGGHGTMGYNDWSQATLQNVFNQTYLSSIRRNSFVNYSYIDLEHVWNIGGTPNITTSTRSQFFEAERSDIISSVMSSETWVGAIGLVYPSDVGYATSSTKAECDSTVMYNWNGTGNVENCKVNSWIINENARQLTITPVTDDDHRIFYVNALGRVGSVNANYSAIVAHPVLYLKSNIGIVEGKGSYQEPFVLGAG